MEVGVLRQYRVPLDELWIVKEQSEFWGYDFERDEQGLP